MTFLTRDGLGKLAPKSAQGALLFSGSPAEYGLPLTEPEVAAMLALSRRTLEAAGLAKNDKVLFAIAQDGSPSVGLLAQAAAGLVTSVAVTAPKGRLRLLSTIRTLKPNVLVTTPCGAADFLARLYLEFNVDPIELDLTKIVLIGEIASAGVRKRLAKEFESDVVGGLVEVDEFVALGAIYIDGVLHAGVKEGDGCGGWADFAGEVEGGAATPLGDQRLGDDETG